MQYFRQEKAEIAAIRQEEKRAAEAKARFRSAPARLEREKAARLERHKSAAVQPAAKDKDAIAAALARVKEKQARATQPIVIKAGERPDNSAIIAAREARKAQARAKQAELQQTNDAATVADPRKLQLKRLLPAPKHASWNSNKPMRSQNNRSIRAKPPSKPLSPAPKHASWNSNRPMRSQKNRSIRAKPPSKPLSPAPKHASWNSNRLMRSQKNRLIRAKLPSKRLLHAKARKLEQQQQANAEPEEQVDPRKAAVEAAIARAKARKLEQQQQANAEPEEQVDPRKAAVEAAIARAKARKLEQQQANAEPEEQIDPRKAAVAAAIARAQAKSRPAKVVNED